MNWMWFLHWLHWYRCHHKPPKPPHAKVKVKIKFSKPIPKFGLASDATTIHHPFKEDSMPTFETTCTITEKVKATVTLAGTSAPITSLALSVLSGDGTFSQVEADGTSLPVNQFYVAGSALNSDTIYDVVVSYGDNKTADATVVLHIAGDGTVSVTITFDAPVPK